MTRRLTRADFNELSRRGLLDDATIRGGNAPDRKWSNAQKNTVDGLSFPSKVEASVFVWLRHKYGAEAIRRNVRMPLLAGAGKLLYLTVDFCIVRDGKPVLWVDAKTKRKSREWARGISLFQATWGTIVEWDGIGDTP